MLNIPLKPSFRYVHEPLRAEESALPPLGNAALVEELQSRIRHSRGGTFLITGFRGVGKSTLVLRALDGIEAESGSAELIIPVSLSVARSTTTERLLFAIVRRVFETLSDSGVLDRLPLETRHSLLLSYMRTSISFKETQSEARERAAVLELGAGSGKGIKAALDYVVPKANLSAKRTKTMAMEATFLAYSETDVEHDLIRIVSLVDKETHLLDPARSRWRRFWPWPRPTPTQLRLVIVLDEVDKLTADTAGLAAVEELLSGIKNVLTMPGVHFLIVAGPDLHDRAVRDAARGNGVYESVFGWRMYVPCSWDAPDSLIDHLVEGDRNEDLDALAQYLRFKARGVPRRLIHEFNSFVTWEAGAPRLVIGDDDLERIRFYATLEGILYEHSQGNGTRVLFPVPIDEDRWRLGGYYVVDWVLKSEGDPFSARELFREGEAVDFDPLLRLSERHVSRLLDHLAEHEILQILRDPNASATFIGDVAESNERVYRLTDEVRRVLYGFVAQNESERADTIGPPDEGPTGFGDPALRLRDPAPPGRSQQLLFERYEKVSVLGQGGMGTVYLVYDRRLFRYAALKIAEVNRHSSANSQLLSRFRREARIGALLRHPRIVRVYDVLEDDEGTIGIVMEHLEGPDLSLHVRENGPLSSEETVLLGAQLAETLSYIAAQGVVRIDMKPQNILLEQRRGPVIIDFGIARIEGATEITVAGSMIGTPHYMSPEAFMGEPLDARTDLYSLGLVLGFCLTGAPLRGGSAMPELMRSAVGDPPDLSDLPVSPEFRATLSRLLETSRDQRFQSADELREALTTLPEWDVARGLPSSFSETRIEEGLGSDEH